MKVSFVYHSGRVRRMDQKLADVLRRLGHGKCAAIGDDLEQMVLLSDAPATKPDLEQMTIVELRQFARDNALKTDLRLGVDGLRLAIRAELEPV